MEERGRFGPCSLANRAWMGQLERIASVVEPEDLGHGTQLREPKSSDVTDRLNSQNIQPTRIRASRYPPNGPTTSNQRSPGPEGRYVDVRLRLSSRRKSNRATEMKARAQMHEIFRVLMSGVFCSRL